MPISFDNNVDTAIFKVKIDDQVIMKIDEFLINCCSEQQGYYEIFKKVHVAQSNFWYPVKQLM